MARPNETDHRFLGLDVDEVSLVDTPANEEEWLVVKRKEGDPNMSTKKDKKAEDVKKSAEEKASEKDEKTKAEAKAPEKAEKAEVETTPVDTEKATLEAVMSRLEKLEQMLKGQKAEKSDETTQKSLLGVSSEGDLILNEELLTNVKKAKAFTSGRVGAISDAVKAMVAVLKEVSPEAVEKIFSTESKTVAKAVSEDPEPAEQDLGGTVTEAVAKALTPIDDRLKALEGIRGEPKGVTDQTADITKRQDDDNLWAGAF